MIKLATVFSGIGAIERQKKNQQFNWHGDFVFQSEEDAEANAIPELEKYFLSEKVRKYVLATGTKNFYSKPKTDLDIARPLLNTMHNYHIKLPNISYISFIKLRN